MLSGRPEDNPRQTVAVIHEQVVPTTPEAELGEQPFCSVSLHNKGLPTPQTSTSCCNFMISYSCGNGQKEEDVGVTVGQKLEPEPGRRTGSRS